MDCRQRKTQEALYQAFRELLAEKDYARITVTDIIGRAGVGRTTFYAHFDTKDALLDSICDTIFEHVFDTPEHAETHHDYSQTPADLRSSTAHLLHHIEENDLGVADLLRGRSGDVVAAHFRRSLYDQASHAIEQGSALIGSCDLPRSYLAHHFAVSLIGTIHWWVMHDMQESPEVLADYFARVMGA